MRRKKKSWKTLQRHNAHSANNQEITKNKTEKKSNERSRTTTAKQETKCNTSQAVYSNSSKHTLSKDAEKSQINIVLRYVFATRLAPVWNDPFGSVLAALMCCGARKITLKQQFLYAVPFAAFQIGLLASIW